MKRALALLLIASLAFLLCACGNDDDPNKQAAVETATPVPQVTAVPAATPTPIPVLNASSYVMQWKNDASRGINYQVPTHWTMTASGERYIVFSEPVPDGESGFRVAYVNKKKASTQDNDKMRDELRKLMKEMTAMYADFKWDGEISRDYYLVKFKGFSAEYTYTDDNGEPMQGIVVISHYDRRIYCINYSGPVSRYAEMKGIFNKMLDNLTRVS